MKSLLTTAIVGLMLLGIASGVVKPNNPAQKNVTAVTGDIGPLPSCIPGRPGCK